MNEPTEIGAVNEGLRLRYGVQGGPGPILTFATDGFPVVQVGDGEMDAELRWLSQSKLCAVAVTRAADAGNQSAVQLVNPAGSGMIAVFTAIYLRLDTADDIFVTMAAAAGAGSTRGFFRDGRGWPATPARTACIGGTGVGAFSQTLGILRHQPTTDQLLEHREEYVVTPGEVLTFASSAVNRAINATLYWRERAMTSGELRSTT